MVVRTGRFGSGLGRAGNVLRGTGIRCGGRHATLDGGMLGSCGVHINSRVVCGGEGCGIRDTVVGDGGLVCIVLTPVKFGCFGRGVPVRHLMWSSCW